MLQAINRVTGKGQYFAVNRYRYRDERKRNFIRRLVKEGKVKYGPRDRDYIRVYDPRRAGDFNRHQLKFHEKMRGTYRKNCYWHIEQMRKQGHACKYHMKNFWYNKGLYWHRKPSLIKERRK